MVDWAACIQPFARRCNQRAADLKASSQRVHDEAEVVARNYTSATLQMTASLRDIGVWRAMPAFSDVCSLHFNVKDLCASADASVSIKRLAGQWEERHLGIPKAAGVKAKGVKEGKKCFIEGMCHCFRSREGHRCELMWRSASKSMRSIFSPKEEQDMLMSARMVAVFIGKAGTTVETIVVHHIPVQYLRPWRPTFLQMRPSSQEEQEALMKLCQGPFPRQESSRYIAFRVLGSAEEGPTFRTTLEAMADLQSDLTWYVSTMRLSNRVVPWPNSSGQVKAFFAAGAEELFFWEPRCADAHKKAKETDSDKVDSASEDEGEKAEEDLALDKDLLALWEEVSTRPRQHPDTSRKTTTSATARSSSSSSSSTSSSSSSTSSHPALVKAEPAEQERVAVEAQPDTQQKMTGEQRKLPEGVARDRSRNFVFGMHHLVPRYKDGRLSGYQAYCKASTHVRCTRELSITVAKGESSCRRILKAWLLLGAGATSREEHMAREHRELLQSALETGLLLDESALDRLAPSSSTDTVEVPFNFENTDKKEQQPVCGEGVLGPCAPEVRPAFHDEMTALALRGDLPHTSLSQRTRNRRSVSSTYIVPDALREALAFGYVHPNIPPPRGLVWEAAGGRWKLCMRGG